MTTPEQHQLILFWYPYFKFEQISGIRSSNISSVEFEHIKCGFDQCDTPQYDTTICYFALSEWYLFISIFNRCFCNITFMFGCLIEIFWCLLCKNNHCKVYPKISVSTLWAKSWKRISPFNAVQITQWWWLFCMAHYYPREVTLSGYDGPLAHLYLGTG